MRVSGGTGFGPEGAGAGDAAPFSIGGPSSLTLDGRSGKATFTVANQTGRSVRARVFAQPGAGTDAAWLQLVGDVERPLAEAGTATVDVTVTVPQDAPAGPATFTLGAALEDAPDRVVSSPSVSFEVPPTGARKFPWWIVIVVVVALAVLGGGGLLIWNLTRGGEPEPTGSPSPSSSVFLSDDFAVDTSSKSVDLDGDGTPDIQVDDADLGSAIPAERPTMVYGLMKGIAVVDEATPEACRSVVLESSVEVPHAADGVFLCVFTSGDHSGFLEFGPTAADQTRQVQVTLWE